MNDKQIISDYSIHYLYQISEKESVKRHIEAYYFKKYKIGLKNIAYKIVKNNFDIDDCLQDAYFVIMKNLKWFDYRKINHIDGFRFWKYTSLALKDQIFRNLHNARVNNTVTLSHDIIEYFQNEDRIKNNLQPLIENEIVDKVHREEWKAELKPRYKLIVDKLEEGYSLREIGDFVGVSRQRVFQNLDKIRREYANYKYKAS